MAYNQKKIFDQIKVLIEAEKLIDVKEVVAYLPICRATFYNWFPDESDKLDTIKEWIENQKIKNKVPQRKKWLDSDNATLQLAYYKLNATPEELRKLSMQHNVLEGGENPIQIDFTD